MSGKAQGEKQAAQEAHLVNHSSDLAWAACQEALVLRDADRELHGTAEDLVLELMRGVREVKKQEEDKVRR